MPFWSRKPRQRSMSTARESIVVWQAVPVPSTYARSGRRLISTRSNRSSSSVRSHGTDRLLLLFYSIFYLSPRYFLGCRSADPRRGPLCSPPLPPQALHSASSPSPAFAPDISSLIPSSSRSNAYLLFVPARLRPHACIHHCHHSHFSPSQAGHRNLQCRPPNMHLSLSPTHRRPRQSQ